MNVVRRFLVAPALVRLIRKERGGSRITEGYFAPQAGRTSFVRVDGQDCHLILVSKAADGSAAEERTEVPRAHGDALLDVCPGKAVYDRTTLPLGGGLDVTIDRYSTPNGLDLAIVSFEDEAKAEAFAVPNWFGRDVSAEPEYERHAIALKGLPAPDAPELSNAALDAVLDLLEPRFGFGSSGSGLRRPIGNGPAATPVAAKPPEPPAAKPPEAAKPNTPAPAAAPANQAAAPANPAAAPPPPAKPADPPAAKPSEAAKPTTPAATSPAAPPPAKPAEPPAARPPEAAKPNPPAEPSSAAKPAANPPAATSPAAPPPAKPAEPPAAKPNPSAEATSAAKPAAAPPAVAVAAAGAPVAAASQAPPAPAKSAEPPNVTAAEKTAPAPAAKPPGAAEGAEGKNAVKSDARIDDVIESLSQALSAAIQQPREPAREDDLDASFERWTVRPRRTNQN